MECKCETCTRKDCPERTTQDDLRIVICCDDYIEHEITNADRFRAMSDEEQQKCVRRFWEIEDFADWLKQPAEGE